MMDGFYPDLRRLKGPGPLVAWMGHVCDVLGVTGRFDAYAEALMELARRGHRHRGGRFAGVLAIVGPRGSRPVHRGWWRSEMPFRS